MSVCADCFMSWWPSRCTACWCLPGCTASGCTVVCWLVSQGQECGDFVQLLTSFDSKVKAM